MLGSHCGVNIIEKTRHYVAFAGLYWEIDVDEGLLAGTVLAEVELDRLDQEVSLPLWAGEAVTGRLEYKKSVMLEARRAGRASGRPTP